MPSATYRYAHRIYLCVHAASHYKTDFLIAQETQAALESRNNGEGKKGVPRHAAVQITAAVGGRICGGARRTHRNSQKSYNCPPRPKASWRRFHGAPLQRGQRQLHVAILPKRQTTKWHGKSMRHRASPTLVQQKIYWSQTAACIKRHQRRTECDEHMGSRKVQNEDAAWS